MRPTLGQMSNAREWLFDMFLARQLQLQHLVTRLVDIPGGTLSGNIWRGTVQDTSFIPCREIDDMTTFRKAG